MFFGVRAGGGGEFARIHSVERSFAADAGFGLLPHQICEILRDSGALDEGVSDIDVELEGDGKFVVHQAGGDEDALRAAELQIAMANRAVAEGNVVAVGDDGLVSLIDGERDEVIRLAIKRRSDRLGDDGDHAFDISAGNIHFAGNGVTDSVRSLRTGVSRTTSVGGRVMAWTACDIVAILAHGQRRIDSGGAGEGTFPYTSCSVD